MFHFLSFFWPRDSCHWSMSKDDHFPNISFVQWAFLYSVGFLLTHPVNCVHGCGVDCGRLQTCHQNGETRRVRGAGHVCVTAGHMQSRSLVCVRVYGWMGVCVCVVCVCVCVCVTVTTMSCCESTVSKHCADRLSSGCSIKIPSARVIQL